MDTSDRIYEAPKVVTLSELERRRPEFEIPDGALEAFKAGAAPVVVFLRATGETYQLADPQDNCPPAEPRRLD